MKTGLGKLTLMAGMAVLAWPTLAQKANPNETAPAATPKPASSALRPMAQNMSTGADTSPRAAQRAPVLRTIAAAGSIIHTVNGVVVSANIALIQPPSAGFVYEP